VIGDIELVAIPRFAAGTNLLGEPVSFHSLLDEAVLENYRVVRGDEKFKKLDVGMCYCDLFIQPDPATWGVNMMIRTGSADFSKWMVTPRFKGGAMPSWLHSHGARLWSGSIVLDTPEEEDVFEAMGLRWIEPEVRTQGFWDQLQRFLKR
jgi:DNA polymerase/3'-5' exonuclease PolX